MVDVAGSTNRSSEYRSDDDHFPTPRGAIVPIVRALMLSGSRVWEPACGDGAMAEVLVEYGCKVVATNLTDRGYGETGRDFLAETKLLAPVIITNPPFNIIDDFVEHALHLKPETLLILARTKFVEGAARHRRILGPTPPSAVYQFIQRVKFYAGDVSEDRQPGWNTEAFAWFVWRRGWRGDTVLRWLDVDDGLQFPLPFTP